MNIRKGLHLQATFLVVLLLALPAGAEEAQCCINWVNLNLTPGQNLKIQELDNQWSECYVNLQSSIVEDQRNLTGLLSDPKSDPVEIMSLQQSITRKQEQLRSKATATYLQKRQILNGEQQLVLQDMVRKAIAERQRLNSSQTQNDALPDRIQNLMQRVRNIFPPQN